MLNGLFTAGRLNVDGVGAIAGRSNGKPYTAAGALAVVIDGVPSYGDQGFMFDAAGRLCVASVAAITSYENGVAFAANGALAVAAGGAVAAQANGLGFTSAGRLVTT